MGSDEDKVKEQYKCDLCEMLVKNMKVHKKLNHKKKKQKLSGFTPTCSVSQFKSKKIQTPNYFLRRAEIHKSELLDKSKVPKPVNKEIAEKLSSISDYVYNETVNYANAINEIQTSTNAFESSDVPESKNRKVFEHQLNLMGLQQMSSIVKRNIEKLKVEQCPECKGLFQVNGRVLLREFKEHVGVCGLGGICGPSSIILEVKKDNLDAIEEHPENRCEIKEEENPANILPCEMWTDVLHTDIGQDSIQGRIMKTKLSNLVKLEPTDLQVEVKVEPCDVEVKVEIKEEPL